MAKTRSAAMDAGDDGRSLTENNDTDTPMSVAGNMGVTANGSGGAIRRFRFVSR